MNYEPDELYGPDRETRNLKKNRDPDNPVPDCMSLYRIFLEDGRRF